MMDKPKARIDASALRLFYFQGITNTGINLILKEASAFKKSFYRNTPSKEDLIESSIKTRQQRYAVFFERLMDMTDDFEKH